MVLDELSQPPFEPFESIDLQRLSLKRALLLAITPAKWMSEFVSTFFLYAVFSV